ncbi:39S ribosomal protein L47, mitochondrial [Electrophorus electricus]|uniref:Large ribosomal subunit protein uL29m n=1 Tax=Electrophorus electricus TaxID=8005 RepID=A0A4W4G9A3_ELEEL|nr:39S ribosomal protein L47, mitochondrial [Electrophorus electricus]
MATATACRLAAVCRQFQRVVKIPLPTKAQYSSPALGNYHYCAQSRPVQYRFLHTSSSRWGLEEFFDLPENWGEATVKSGAPWTSKHLRSKSNEDLHKLWYVLLKEKNMLLTIQQESKRQCVQMPSPERIKKVNRSMQRLDGVVKEREDALRLLQTGQEKGRPGEWRRNVFGKMFWYRFREHPVPWYMNKIYKRKRFYTPLFVAPYTRISLEKHLRSKMRRERKEKQNQKKLSAMFSKKTAQI